MPDSLNGVPAYRWWPALLLAILDTGLYAPELLRLKLDAYNRKDGTLKVGRLKLLLHSHTVNALEGLRKYEREMLFPWPKDGGQAPFSMLYHDYREILEMAGLPPTEKKPMLRLRATALDCPEILDCIDPYKHFFPIPRKGDRRYQKDKGPRKPRDRKRETAGAYLIRNDAPDTLKRYFAETYQPLKLVNCSPKTLEKYESVIRKFSEFLACDATLHHLTDETLDRFIAFSAKRVQASSVNSYITNLLAIWRHAWKKRKVAELPRDVDKLRENKTLPDAWTVEELGRLIKAACEIDCRSVGMPGRQWWPAMILTLYDTGLRIGAALKIKAEELDLEAGLVRVRAEDQKHKADQFFHLHEDTRNALWLIGADRRELVFNVPNPVAFKTTMYAQFNRILKAAGLYKGEGGDKFHKIRRTSATCLADATSPAESQKHLGHSSMSVTMRYLDFTKIRSHISPADVMERPRIDKDAS
jgi:integrase